MPPAGPPSCIRHDDAQPLQRRPEGHPRGVRRRQPFEQRELPELVAALDAADDQGPVAWVRCSRPYGRVIGRSPRGRQHRPCW